MEGRIARWYASSRRNDMEDFRREAKGAAEWLPRCAQVLEVAPGPGLFAIELAKLGDFRITGLDISQTLVQIATENAQKEGVIVDFRLGNASAMPFSNETFDFVYCSAAFKNFTEPVKALNEMYRVLRPNGEVRIVDLRKECPMDEIEAYLKRSGRSRIDTWMAKWTFRLILLKRAYGEQDFIRMSQQSRFGQCTVADSGIGMAVRLAKLAG
jgi:ubiquinone/menaquinone biosynthesis C-methylase UbiE